MGVFTWLAPTPRMPSLRCPIIRFLAASSAIKCSLAAIRDLPTRVTDGECSDADIAGVETYFEPKNQAALKSTATAADLFTLAYGTTFKVVVSLVSKEQYVLTQCGQARPKDSEIDYVAPLGENFARKHFTVPVQSALALSTTHQGFLALLGVQDRIDRVDASSSGPCWQKAVGCGAVLESPWGGNASKRAEQIAAAEVVFMSCASPCDNVRETGNGVHVPASYDSGLLETAEYIKFFAAFFNKEPKANDLYLGMQRDFESATSGVTEKPTVAWITTRGPPYYSEEYIISLAAYKAEMAQVAGGANLKDADLSSLSGVISVDAVTGHSVAGKNYIFNKSNSTIVEAFFSALQTVDVVIDESYEPDHAAYTFEAFLENFGIENNSALSFVTNKMVLRKDGTLSPTGGEDWFESRLSDPAAAVLGLSRALHGVSKPFKFFRNIGSGELPVVVNSSQCKMTLPACNAAKFPDTIPTLGGEVGRETAASMAIAMRASALIPIILARFAY